MIGVEGVFGWLGKHLSLLNTKGIADDEPSSVDCCYQVIF